MQADPTTPKGVALPLREDGEGRGFFGVPTRQREASYTQESRR
jgi:hypothetical protein